VGKKGSSWAKRAELERCANCDENLFVDNQTLFCDESCQQMARYVRYARSVRKDPKRCIDPDVTEALRIQLAFVLGGGYPERERRLSQAERRLICERDGGHCQICGKPGDQIDHVAGSSNDPSNLQLLCDPCHRTKTMTNFAPAGPKAVAFAHKLRTDRVEPTNPSRPCDDEVSWKIESRRRKAARIDLLWEWVFECNNSTKSDWEGMSWDEVVQEVCAEMMG
jgi:5-methylcytosine-specific restriction endonuclease McrA